jgi:hypothetical protein
LVALLVGLEMEGPSILAIDMLEQGLDEATQEALIAYLRHRHRVAARTGVTAALASGGTTSLLACDHSNCDL